MTQFWKLLAACTLVSPLVLGAQEPASPTTEHEQHAAPAPEQGAEGHSMASMHERMGQMRDQMARIRASEDPADRERLMREHMESMQRHMEMMDAMQGAKPAASPGRCAEGDAPVNR